MYVMWKLLCYDTFYTFYSSTYSSLFISKHIILSIKTQNFTYNLNEEQHNNKQ